MLRLECYYSNAKVRRMRKDVKKDEISEGR